MRIAFIDDGICQTHFISCNGNKIVEHWIFSGTDVALFDGPTNILSHGTVCASIFAEYAHNFDLVDLSVFSETNPEETISSVICALAWCLFNHIDLISMSIGTLSCECSRQLEQAVRLLYTNNIPLIAACCNNNKLTFPACFKESIGVRSLLGKHNTHSFFCATPIDGIEVHTVLPHKCMCIRNFYPNFDELNFIPNSWTTSYVAALVTHMNFPLTPQNAKKHLMQQLTTLSFENQCQYYDDLCQQSGLEQETAYPIVIALGFPISSLYEIMGHFYKAEYICLTISKHEIKFCLNHSIELSMLFEKCMFKVAIWAGFLYSAELVIINCVLDDLSKHELCKSDIVIAGQGTCISNLHGIFSLCQGQDETLEVFTKKIISSLVCEEKSEDNA